VLPIRMTGGRLLLPDVASQAAGTSRRTARSSLVSAIFYGIPSLTCSRRPVKRELRQANEN